MTGSHLYRYGINKINWWSVLRLHWQKRSVLEINTILPAINKRIVKHCIHSQSYRLVTHLLFLITQVHDHIKEMQSSRYCNCKIAKEANRMAGHKELMWYLPPAWQNFLEDVVLWAVGKGSVQNFVFELQQPGKGTGRFAC